MSKTSTFDAPGDAGFYQSITPDTARQQLNMSVGLVVALAFLAAAIGLSAGFGPVSDPAGSIQTGAQMVQAPQFVHSQQATTARPLSGG